MIKMTVDKGNISGMIKGNLHDLCAETVLLVKHIYTSIKEHDEESAETFERMVSRAFKDDIVFSDKKLKDVIKKMCDGDYEYDDDDDDDDEDEEFDKADLDDLFGDALDSLRKSLEKLKDSMK